MKCSTWSASFQAYNKSCVLELFIKELSQTLTIIFEKLSVLDVSPGPEYGYDQYSLKSNLSYKFGF